MLVLHRAGLCLEAQLVARTIFELRLSFDAFIELLRADLKGACYRVLDAWKLEKAKQARASEFKGFDLAPGAPTPDELRASDREIAERYDDADLGRLKKYGFTGMSVEQRAKRSGLTDEYNIVYRNFSRNVHSTDFTELFLQEDPSGISLDYEDYLERRNVVCCDLVLVSVASMADAVNSHAGLGLDRRFNDLHRAVEGLNSQRRQDSEQRPKSR